VTPCFVNLQTDVLDLAVSALDVHTQQPEAAPLQQWWAPHEHARDSVPQEVVNEPWSRSKLAAHVAALAVSLAVLAAGAVAASRFTSAYWVQVRPHGLLSSC